MLYFILLLFFGKTFTKFSIFGFLYLHDLMVLLITFFALNSYQYLKLRFLPVLIVVGIAVVYLVGSLAIYTPTGTWLTITLRQFMMFFYLGCSYVVFNMLVRQPSDLRRGVQLIVFVGELSVVIQTVYLLVQYAINPFFSLYGEAEYHYLSPLVIMGVIIYAASSMAFEHDSFIRILKTCFAVFLATTLGHSSAFLAIFLIIAFYFFIKIKPRQRIIALLAVLGAIAGLLLLPQFTDANAGWRILYWKHVLGVAITEKWGVWGSGFGQPYMTNEYATYIYEAISSYIMMDSFDPLARYLSPPHNSWLSFVFHIGLLPASLLFFPLKNVVKSVLFDRISQDNTKRFLLFSFVGSFVWVSFNVILELPHSAIFFWMVYFSCICYYQDDMQKDKN